LSWSGALLHSGGFGAVLGAGECDGKPGGRESVSWARHDYGNENETWTGLQPAAFMFDG